MQAKIDKAAGEGMKAVQRIRTDYDQHDYLRMFRFYLHIRNPPWDEVWQFEREETWEGQPYTLWKFLPTTYTLEDWEDCEVMYHGGHFYSSEAIIRAGKMLASEDVKLGHGMLGEKGGVFCTPDPAVAAGYSPGHNIFGDDILHKVVWQIHCKNSYRTAHKSRTSHCNEQSAYGEKGCKVMGCWLGSNTGLVAGGLRFLGWVPSLECTMPGWGENDTVIIDDRGMPCIDLQEAPAAKTRPATIAKAAKPPQCTGCVEEMHSLVNTWICPPCGRTVNKTGTRAAVKAGPAPAAPVAIPTPPVTNPQDTGYTTEEFVQYHKNLEMAVFAQQSPQGEPCWQWRNNNREWCDFGKDHQGELRQAPKRGETRLTLQLPKNRSGELKINPESMKQVNTVTNKVRDIRWAHPNLLDFPRPLGKRAAEPSSGSGEPASKRPRFEIKPKVSSVVAEKVAKISCCQPAKRLPYTMPMPPCMPKHGFGGSIGKGFASQPSSSLVRAVHGLKDPPQTRCCRTKGTTTTTTSGAILNTTTTTTTTTT